MSFDRRRISKASMLDIDLDNTEQQSRNGSRAIWQEKCCIEERQLHAIVQLLAQKRKR
ncbi:1092_t:CDS:2 [Paraglomus brasilianum]|uniref:1092_t:CDS:1 n=1 Tax=Paraglomus brasilianum TaxID=144538 RepID=A0A9N9AKX7_9GLOM|nr:1092_t:CDS:2 [Paraglomus brasilianum]